MSVRRAAKRPSRGFNQPSRTGTHKSISATARAARIGKKHPHKGVKGKHSKASLHLRHRQKG